LSASGAIGTRFAAVASRGSFSHFCSTRAPSEARGKLVGTSVALSCPGARLAIDVGAVGGEGLASSPPKESAVKRGEEFQAITELTASAAFFTRARSPQLGAASVVGGLR
jgi:hypothetical protein